MFLATTLNLNWRLEASKAVERCTVPEDELDSDAKTEATKLVVLESRVDNDNQEEEEVQPPVQTKFDARDEMMTVSTRRMLRRRIWQAAIVVSVFLVAVSIR